MRPLLVGILAAARAVTVHRGTMIEGLVVMVPVGTLTAVPAAKVVVTDLAETTIEVHAVTAIEVLARTAKAPAANAVGRVAITAPVARAGVLAAIQVATTGRRSTRLARARDRGRASRTSTSWSRPLEASKAC